MSYTDILRKNISDNLPRKKCCLTSFLYGLCYTRFSAGKVKFKNRNEIDLFEKLYNLIFKQSVSIDGFEIQDKEVNDNILELFNIADFSDFTLSGIVFECENCQMNFVRGVVFTSSMFSNPNNGYRFEIKTRNKDVYSTIKQISDFSSLSFKSYKRNGEYVLYMNNFNIISNFFGYLSLNRMMFDLINTAMLREEKAMINRKLNYETSNLSRTIIANAGYIKAFQDLVDSGRINSLSSELKNTCLLRLENPELSLRELADMHNPKITKSGLNHRLKKIMEFYENE